MLGLVDDGAGDPCVALESLNPLDGVLVVARDGAAFDEAEVDLVAGIGPVLGMALRMSAALDAERVTGLISNNAPRRTAGFSTGFENGRAFSIASTASNSRSRTGSRFSRFSMPSPTAPATCLGSTGRPSGCAAEGPTRELTLVSHTGTAGSVGPARRTQVGERIPASVFEEGRLVARYDLVDSAHMSTAIEVDGAIVGCLSVGDDPAHRFSSAEEEALLAFAQHASLAMQDAQAGDQMRKSLERERHRASHDGLTSLPNRATIRAELGRRLASANDEATTVLFVDLDRFKLANDTLGHAFGDEVLTVIADRLRTTVREQDLVGRLSGDEFVVVCEQMTAVGAQELAARPAGGHRPPDLVR